MLEERDLKNLWLVVHTHRHGTSHGLLRSRKKLTPAGLEKFMIENFDFEPERDDEWYELVRLSECRLYDFDNKERKNA